MPNPAPEFTLVPTVKNSTRVVIAAGEGRAYPIIWVKDAINIVVVAWHPVIVARGIGGDRKEHRIVPPRAPVREMVAPCADAVFERQRIKAKRAVRIADKIRITLLPRCEIPTPLGPRLWI
jgi:hypothetical protein